MNGSSEFAAKSYVPSSAVVFFNLDERPPMHCPICGRVMEASGSVPEDEHGSLTAYQCVNCTTRFMDVPAPATFFVNDHGEIIESNVPDFEGDIN